MIGQSYNVFLVKPLYVSMSSSPIGLLILPFVFIAFLKWPRKGVIVVDTPRRVGIVRRYFALCIDIYFVIGSFFAAFYGIYYYIKWHFDRNRQTAGQYVLKFKIVAADENPMLSVRYLTAWAVLAWWPFWPWTIFRSREYFTWETASRTKTVNMAPKTI